VLWCVAVYFAVCAVVCAVCCDVLSLKYVCNPPDCDGIKVLHCVAVCCGVCSVLQCVEVCCSVLQCVAVCCSVTDVLSVKYVSNLPERDGITGT